ncbi:MAG: DinB family protein [Candidatus Nanopelagicales bacterium]
MTISFPSPTDVVDSRTEVLLGYLDYFRSTILHKLDDLPDEVLRSTQLPSGWTPLELLKHLTYVELRWLVWGFEGSVVPEPFGDRRDDRWYVAGDESLDQLVAALNAQAATTRHIVQEHHLSEVGQPGPRWDGADPATLERVLLHLVQEYARHAGHLDVVRELIDGQVGE